MSGYRVIVKADIDGHEYTANVVDGDIQFWRPYHGDLVMTARLVGDSWASTVPPYRGSWLAEPAPILAFLERHGSPIDRTPSQNPLTRC